MLVARFRRWCHLIWCMPGGHRGMEASTGKTLHWLGCSCGRTFWGEWPVWIEWAEAHARLML